MCRTRRCCSPPRHGVARPACRAAFPRLLQCHAGRSDRERANVVRQGFTCGPGRSTPVGVC
jgi:hypothetical protein